MLGIDYANDNIHNRMDGACEVFKYEKKDENLMPYALFVHGDSSEISKIIPESLRNVERW